MDWPINIGRLGCFRFHAPTRFPFIALTGLPFPPCVQISGLAGSNILPFSRAPSGFPFYQFYQFTDFAILARSFVPPFSAKSIPDPVGLPPRHFTDPPGLAVLPIYHFCALNGCSVSLFTAFRSCLFAILPFYAPASSTI